MRCFIQDLSLNFDFLLDLFLHGGTSSSWQSFAVSGAMLTQPIEWKIFNFHLMYLSKEHINLNGKK